jgi:anti-anti-sigma factor
MVHDPTVPDLPSPRRPAEDLTTVDAAGGTGFAGFPGDVIVFFDPAHTLVQLTGDIDIAVADDLEHAGRDAIDASTDIVCDIRRVSMIDSVGVSFLVRLAAACRDGGRSITLLGPAPRVHEVLEIVGAERLFTWRSGSGQLAAPTGE